MSGMNLKNVKSLVVALTIAMPVGAWAAGNTDTFMLKNQTKQSGPGAYYLVQDWIWNKKGCVVEPKMETKGKKINPGESAPLTIKKGCIWGGVKYDIFKVGDDKNMVGTLSHSFRDGKTFIEISMACQGSECVFSDLNPTQQRSN